MKLNIPTLQCNFTLFTTACIVGGVTSRFLSQIFLNISQQNEASTAQIESAVIEESSYYRCENGLFHIICVEDYYKYNSTQPSLKAKIFNKTAK